MLFKIRDLIKAYKDGLPACTFDEKEHDKLMGSMPNPLFGSAAPHLKSGNGKKALLHIPVLKYIPDFGGSESQEAPDCTSHGTRNAVDTTRIIEIVNGDNEDFYLRGATEGIYGARGGNFQGMSVDTAARFVNQTGGILVRQKYGDIDLSKYNPNLAIRWGSTGVPSSLLQVAKKNQVRQIANISTIQEAKDALFNGYAISVGSNIGFSEQRDKNGISRRQGSWNHCYKAGTIIAGEIYNNIEDVKKNDLVFNHLGHYEKVKKVFKREYDGVIVKIKARGLPTIEVTEEHPILVYRDISFVGRTPNGFKSDDPDTFIYRTTGKLVIILKKMWVNAGDILPTDFLVTPKVYFGSSPFSGLKYVESKKKNKKTPIDIAAPDDDIAWMFGLYIGDGNTTKNHKVSFTFSSKEKSYLSKLKIAFEKLGFDIHVKDFGTYYRVHCYSAILARSFDRWFGKYSTDRQIPDFLIREGWNIDAVIDGIYCADGFNSKDIPWIGMSCKKLIFQIRNLLINKDQLPTIHRQTHTSSSYNPGSHSYVIKIEDSNHSTLIKDHDNNLLNKVKSISKEHYVGNVYNLEVTGEHTYIADGVATHNCMSVISMDDTKEVINKGLYLVQNSWGPNWNSGPKLYDQPDGSFWITEDDFYSMIAQRQAWVFSNVVGFPPQNVKWTIGDVL